MEFVIDQPPSQKSWTHHWRLRVHVKPDGYCTLAGSKRGHSGVRHRSVRVVCPRRRVGTNVGMANYGRNANSERVRQHQNFLVSRNGLTLLRRGVVRTERIGNFARRVSIRTAPDLLHSPFFNSTLSVRARPFRLRPGTIWARNAHNRCDTRDSLDGRHRVRVSVPV